MITLVGTRDVFAYMALFFTIVNCIKLLFGRRGITADTALLQIIGLMGFVVSEIIVIIGT